MKARFDDLESQYSFTCPTHDHSKEEGELIRKIDGVATAVQGAFNEVKVEVEGGLNDVNVGMKAGFTEVEGGFTSSVKGEMKEGFYEMKVEMERGFGDTKTKLCDVIDELGMISGRLDKVLESTQESLMRLRDLQAPN